jgi:hypothetical protein
LVTATVVVIPVVVAGYSATPEPTLVWMSIPVITLVSFGAALALGPDRTAHLLAHLWGNAEPENLWVTFSLWGGIVAIAGASYLLLWRQ